MASRAKRRPIAIPEHSPIPIDASAFPAFPRLDRKSLHKSQRHNSSPSWNMLPQRNCTGRLTPSFVLGSILHASGGIHAADIWACIYPHRAFHAGTLRRSRTKYMRQRSFQPS